MMKSAIPAVFIIALTLSGIAQTAGTWDFIYPGDDPARSCPIDLRYLNEQYAGEHGFIQLSTSGDSFLRGDGQPIRFWAVNLDAQLYSMSDSALTTCARFLAKMGVNMIRLHCSINPYFKDSKMTDLDTAEVKTIWRFVAFMKKEGIYSTISPFWAHNWFMGEWVPPSWNLNGYKEKDHLWGVMFFNDSLQDAYKQWVKYLYTTINPYTGIALRDDPAVGIIQIKNEDSVFWYSMDVFQKPEFKNLIVEKYTHWLSRKYGSVQNACTAWGTANLPADDPDHKYVDLFAIWEMTREQSGDRAIRMNDQVSFYAETQYNFFREIYDYYRNDLECRQLINACNWKAADPALLNDLERWTNSCCDVMAVNRYVANNHIGENSSWRTDPGDYFQSGSLLTHPGQLPINIKQIKSKPFIVSESSWVMPNKYATEAPFMISAYQSLTGVDAYYWFTINDPLYENQYWKQFPLDSGTWKPITHSADQSAAQHAPVDRLIQYPLQQFSASTPFTIGMFPANALAFRMGYIQESDPVFAEERTLPSLIMRERPAIFEEGYDSNRDQEMFKPDTSENKTLSQLIFLTGKISVAYDAEADRSVMMPGIESCFDQHRKTIRSVTGEIEWDYENGLCTVNAPKAQGVCGFLNKKGAFALQAVKIETQNEYGAINIVSLDNAPVEKSKKLLVQVGTNYLPTGWEDRPAQFEFEQHMLDGLQILNTGTMPWQVRNTLVTLEIRNPFLTKATLLDTAGYAKVEVKSENINGRFTVRLPENTMYMIIE